MEEDKVRLVVMGLSYNPIRDGAYALILAEMNGPYRIPVVIGAAEAQSIAVAIEKIVTQRPLTHDLFVSMFHVYGIMLKEVFIYNFEDGIFYANMLFTNLEGEQVEIDSRTSDAIAVAIRTGSPIYTTRQILESSGFVLEKKGPGKGIASGRNIDGMSIQIEWDEDGSNEVNEMEKVMGGTPSEGSDYTFYTEEELVQMLSEAVANEDYETAREIKEYLEKINNKDKNTDNQP